MITLTCWWTKHHGKQQQAEVSKLRAKQENYYPTLLCHAAISAEESQNLRIQKQYLEQEASQVTI